MRSLLVPLVLVVGCSGPVTPEGTTLRKAELAAGLGGMTPERLAALPGEEKTVVLPFGVGGEAELKVVFTRVVEPGAKDPVFRDLRLEVGKNPRYEVTPGIIGAQIDKRPPGKTGGHRFMAVPLSVKYSWRSWSGTRTGALTAAVHADGTVSDLRNDVDG